ncbi:hypothetical protein PROFUN_03335 [Planoprotostelium fungivorum]|uniref:Uncharacterized protein n=1 Tax=Planoprotostelium fungivorum TaxID=1890364 RepID=A0A2P6NWT7_9EUKA|nr:hypothetical protein PROFUN_03335 [Planoprotostelium fungivorum]
MTESYLLLCAIFCFITGGLILIVNGTFYILKMVGHRRKYEVIDDRTEADSVDDETIPITVGELACIVGCIWVYCTKEGKMSRGLFTGWFIASVVTSVALIALGIGKLMAEKAMSLFVVFKTEECSNAIRSALIRLFNR